MSGIPLEGFKHRFASDAAAGSGFLEIIQWLHFNIQARCTHRGMDVAAGKGHLEKVQWLHVRSTLAMHDAAQNGHLEAVKWLHANRSEGCHILTMKRATEHGDLEMVK
ncbi:hypothetical protein PI124_g19949 [Phytophthora idaei]|nr:hypothetical protein PI125_g17359 [Phytophthora idaei]KAG3137431.1 hypothetical protein PI126_g17405 [Phytophthora idaei]KAG3235013.1 hypothetical protein PI124_g19949 [Phytophthora idaei]